MALKLKMLLRAKTVLFLLIEVKVPTAYMVPPHCTSWRICSFVLVALSCGVWLAGVVDTGPVAAPAGTAAHQARRHPPDHYSGLAPTQQATAPHYATPRMKFTMTAHASLVVMTL